MIMKICLRQRLEDYGIGGNSSSSGCESYLAVAFFLRVPTSLMKKSLLTQRHTLDILMTILLFAVRSNLQTELEERCPWKHLLWFPRRLKLSCVSSDTWTEEDPVVTVAPFDQKRISQSKSEEPIRQKSINFRSITRWGWMSEWCVYRQWKRACKPREMEHSMLTIRGH